MGLVYPFTKQTKIFADVILEMGYFAGLNDVFTSRMTPYFDAGFIFFKGEWAGISIKYCGSWHDGYYTHSIGIGWIVLGW